MLRSFAQIEPLDPAGGGVMATEKESQQEYISDRAIEKADEDLFRHGDIVTELAELATNGPAKTNIALFAPWGTGKSGIAKLLRPKIETENRFAYFDSFKHRETPLRRSFLRAIAKELDEEPDEFDQFYKQNVTRRLKEGSHLNLLGYVAKALAIGLVLMLAISLLLAWPRTEPKDKTYWDSVIAIFTGLGGLAAFIAAFIGVAVTAVAQGLSVEETRTPLSDDDEFEEAFEELAAGKGRLVVFIDELDRCSAGEVVETLETLRVFLDVEDCVFVVAADRQALEQALRHRARQETPADETHPYFSSGGSYIDKIFQCQLSLPPVRPRDMTGFAQTLLTDRGGCWQELRDRGEFSDVIGALIPTHLRSARQVKVLLNAYVVAHRIAAQREKAKEIAPLEGRSAALAQLVCLRTEFPSFAEQLGDYPQLGPALLARDRNSQDPLAGKIPKTWARAGEFIDLQLPIAPLLITPKKEHRSQPPVPPTPDPQEEGGEEPEQAAEEQVSPPPSPPTEEFTDSEAWRIAKRQLEDLLAYLARVKTLPQIDRDLIYLHSAAAAQTALEPELADRLDNAARNGRVADLDALLGDLDDERSGDAIDVLLGSLAEANLDVERTNASRVLLAACSRVSLSDQSADRVAVALGQASGDGGFEAELVPDAIALAARCSKSSQGWILKTVAAGNLNLTDAHALLEAAEMLPSGHILLGRAVTLALTHEDEDCFAAIAGLPEELQRRIVLAGGKRFKGQIDTGKDQAEVEANPGFDPSGKRAEALDVALAFFVGKAPQAALALAIAMAKLDERSTADKLRDHLQALAPVRDPQLILASLELAEHDALAQRPKWLSPLDPGSLPESAGALIDSIAAVSFEDTLRPESEIDQPFQALLPALERLRGAEGHPTAKTEKAVSENVRSAVTEDELANTRARASANVELLAGAGLLRRAAVADAFIEGATASLDSLDSAGPEHVGPGPTVARAIELTRAWSRDAGEVALRGLLDAALRRPEPELARSELTIAAAGALRALDLEVDPPLGTDDLLALVDAHGDSAVPVLVAWLDIFATDADQLWALLEKFWAVGVPPELRVATAARARTLRGSVPADLAALAVAHVIDIAPAGDPENWDAVGLRYGAAEPVVEELAARAEGTLSAEQWSRLLEICRQLVVGHPQARAALAERVLLPLARYDFPLAVSHLGLVSAEDRGLIDELRAIASSEEERRLLGEKIQELGWGKGALESLVSKLFGSTSKPKPRPRADGSEEEPAQGEGAGKDDPQAEKSPEVEP